MSPSPSPKPNRELKEASRSHSSSDTALGEFPKKEDVGDKADIHNSDAVPNGGLNAWLQVGGSFCLSFNTW